MTATCPYCYRDTGEHAHCKEGVLRRSAEARTRSGELRGLAAEARQRAEDNQGVSEERRASTLTVRLTSGV